MSMLIAIGFELIGLMREKWLYHLIELHFLQRIWFLIFSKFSCGIGFIILVVRVIGGGGCQAISFFGGM